MNHYTYLIEFSNGMKYVGARSTHLDPQLDASYLGSGRALPERTIHTCTKTILGTFSSREELIKAEIDFIVLNDCVNSTAYYNLRTKSFDKHGMPDTSGSKLRGRTADNCEYIKRANTKRKTYRGNARTPAQKAHDERMRGMSIGPNPNKGKAGTANNGFTPWYYITPSGEYIEVYHMTRQEFAPTIGATARQVGHRFHYTNEHKKAGNRATAVLRGYIFGSLPRPT